MKKVILTALISLSFMTNINASEQNKKKENTSEISYSVQTKNTIRVIEIYKNGHMIYRDVISENKDYNFINLTDGRYVIKLKNNVNHVLLIKSYDIRTKLIK